MAGQDSEILERTLRDGKSLEDDPGRDLDGSCRPGNSSSRRNKILNVHFFEIVGK